MSRQRHPRQKFCVERVGVLAEYGGVEVRLPLGLRSLTLLRCLSRHSSLVLCSCLTLQAMAPKAYLTGKSKDKVAAKKTRKKPGGPRLRRCWAELHGWSFTRSCFWGWTLAQNQASLDWASSVFRFKGKSRVRSSTESGHVHCWRARWSGQNLPLHETSKGCLQTWL